VTRVEEGIVEWSKTSKSSALAVSLLADGRLASFRHIRVAAIASALSLLAVGCSSGNDTSEPIDEPPTSTSTPTPTSTSTSTLAAVVPGASSEDIAPPTTVDSIVSGFGVDQGTIRVGLSLDLSGPLSGVDSFVLDAHIAYFDAVNASGGIGGRVVDVVALDHASDVDAHIDNVRELLERSDRGVALIASVGGDDMAQAVSPILVEEGAMGISRGHADLGRLAASHIVQLGVKTCVDAYMGVSRLAETTSGADDAPPSVAIVSRANTFGNQSAQGARLASEEAALDIVYQYQGDFDDVGIDEVAAGLILNEPDVVWVAISPRELGNLFLGVAGLNRAWRWGGAFQTYDALLLETSIAAAVSELYTHTAPIDMFDSERSTDRSAQIRRALPDTEYWAADSVSFGWQQAELAHQALLAAADSGELTRENILASHRPEAPNLLETSFFAVDHEQATLRSPISRAGSVGLTEVPGPEADPASARNACAAGS
jgi:ABC-type branched-subunit amino acid transport system substrate-binding protein